MQTLSHPFRFSSGRALTIDDESDAFAAQLIAGILRTGHGELPLAPTYGVDSPVFGRVDTAGLMHSISNFHPHIIVSSVEEVIDPDNEGHIRVRVNFVNSFTEV